MALSFFIRFASAIHQLWLSDGTSLGTKLVASLAGGAISNLRTTGSRVFFNVTDGTRGQELCTSDGTAAGTVLLSDINPGSFRSSPSQLTNVSGTLYFRANDGARGFEPWKSDGTAGGTAIVKDIDPGANGASTDALMFGLPGIDLTSLDPIGGLKGCGTVSGGAYVAGAKVIAAPAIASAFESAGTRFLGAFEDAYAALASDINALATGQSLSLTDQPTLAALLNSVAQTEGVSEPSFVPALSANIGASNSSLDQKLAQHGAGSGPVTDVSTVQQAVQSSLSTHHILLQSTSGQAAIWNMTGINLTSGGVVSPNPGPSWKAIGTGDFNDDGDSDILWQTSTGQVSVWEMAGSALIGGGAVSPNPGPSWRAIGTGVFDGDSHSDILWQNANGQAAIWEMRDNHPSSVGSSRVGPNPGPAWKAIGTGDFNGDGLSDILWQNVNGQAAIWNMIGINLTSGGPVNPNPGPSWTAVGTGDFNRDGHSDILWQNTSSGQVSIWEMNGNTLIGGGAVSPNPGPSWHAIGTGDFNFDRHSDILFQNTSSGQVSIWEMDGNHLIGGGAVSPNPGPSWHAIG